MNPAALPGRGDAATWPAYAGNPNDPRAPLDDDVQDQLDLLADVLDAVRRAEHYIRRTGNPLDRQAVTEIDAAILMLGGRP